ncbi:ClpP/crotonase-like domain-containing protein [Hyaloraphidium curvatum]|nr:ClpP/crotonase-like domain-containing protein [Hyaloraphidium curvatum]
MAYQTIQVEILEADRVGVIKLHRPDAQNAYNPTMGAELSKAFADLEADPRVNVIVLGASGRIFCAGFDFRGSDFSSLKRSDDGPAPPPASNKRRGALFALGSSKVTIAAIQGAAIGVGITMPLTCDLKVAYSKAKIGFIFSRRGIVPEAASSFLLPRLIGAAKALEVFILGDTIEASDPRIAPAFNRIVDSPDAVLPAALDLAREIAKKTSPLSNAFIKSLVWHPRETPEEQTLLEGKMLAWQGGKPDSIESGKAFMEKRDPNFTTRIPEDLPDWFFKDDFGIPKL